VLPKGSLEAATLDLFAAADLEVRRGSEVEYRGPIEDPRISEVFILRPQEIPRYLAEGLFDLGITGRDWIEETSAAVETIAPLAYSKATSNPIRVVLAVAESARWSSAAELPNGIRVQTEYPEMTARYFERIGVQASLSLSYGATEAKIPDIADAVVEITETGRALRAANLRILDTVLVSQTELVANPAAAADPVKRRAMDQIQTLLAGVLEARGRVLVKCNVDAGSLEAVLTLLPALQAPTVGQLAGGAAFAVETVVAKGEINLLIPALREAGASGILEIPIAKLVP
jgi:ATP phosphoribosyltransferase